MLCDLYDTMNLKNPLQTHLKQLPVTTMATFFVLLVCFSLLTLNGWTAWHDRDMQMRESKTATSNMTRAITQHADDTFKAVDTTILGLEERLRNDGTTPAALDRLHEFLMVRIADLSELQGLYIYDERGELLVHSHKLSEKSVNILDREYFVYHSTHPDLTSHIGPPIRGRLTGNWVIPVSRRINHKDGSFAYIVLATIYVDYFRKFYDSFDIGSEGAIILALNSGTMLLRRPFATQFIGKSMANAPIFRDHVAKGGHSGAVMLKSVQDGVERLNSYRLLQHYPLFVSVALSKKEILAQWRATTVLNMTAAVIIVIVLGFLGYRLVGQINLRVQAEAEAKRAGEALQKLNRTLEKLALQDGLTGLANRRQFDIAITDELSRAMRSASSLALVMIDVDCFKQYNDIYGHLAGDECLRKIGRAVQASESRPGDLVARYGGEEISVLLPSTDVAGAIQVAENIRMAIRALQIEHIGNPAGLVTISAGVNALTPARNSDTPDTLINNADKALYQAKSGGRDRVYSYDALVEKLGVAADLESL